jgi:hypothetical protein
MGGTVTYQPELYRDKEKLSTSIQICSFCGDTKFTSHPKLLTELKKEKLGNHNIILLNEEKYGELS